MHNLIRAARGNLDANSVRKTVESLGAQGTSRRPMLTVFVHDTFGWLVIVI